MKHLLAVLITGALSCALFSCDDAQPMTTAWGMMKVDASPEDKVINGVTLAQDGANYKGYCSYKNKRFSFGIGDQPPTDFRFEISGIKGAPSENPYKKDGSLRSNEERTFTKGQIWNREGGWLFDKSNIIEENCLATLFAKSGSGDLTPKKFGKKRFQYVVKMVCHNGLDSIESEYDAAGTPLTGFEFELWFDNCDSE